MNSTPKLDQRIDFIMIHSSDEPDQAEGWQRGHYRAEVVGDQPDDRTPSGLWRADHAGLITSVWARRSLHGK